LSGESPRGAIARYLVEISHQAPADRPMGCGQKQLVRGDPRRVQGEAFGGDVCCLCHDLSPECFAPTSVLNFVLLDR